MSRQWRVGRVLVLRHAGMPFDWLEALGAGDEVVAAADRVLDSAERLIDRAPRLADHVRRGGIVGFPAVKDPEIALLRDAWATARSEYEELYAAADSSAGDRLRDVLRRSDVEEAVFLSNPDAHRNMLTPFVGHTGSLTSKWRRVRRQMYTYVQRFCAKNETVSFFGPMAYGTAGPDTVLHRDRSRVRRVFLSDWAVRALIRAIVKDTRILPDLRFHLLEPIDAPLGTAIEPGGSPFRHIVRSAGLPAKQVALALRGLVGDGAVDIELGGGQYDPAPLRTLRSQLEKLPPSAGRDEWLDRVGSLESLRAALEDQPLDKRIVTVAALEERFSEITGVPARRGAGATYADRAVFFEECASPFALEVSPQLFEEWERRLQPVLEACVAHGDATQAAAVELVRDALREAGFDPSEPLDLETYAARAAAALEAPSTTFQTGHAPVHSPDDLETLIGRAAGLPGDRYAVIDLCASADGEHGLADAELVVARTHHHLLVPSWLGTMYDGEGEFGGEAAEWVRARLGTLVGFDFGRRNKGFYRFPGREVAFRPLTWVDAARADLRRPRDLTVTLRPGRAELHDDQGAPLRAYLPLSDFVKYPPLAALSHPQVVHPVFADDTAQPEVVIGDVVVQRPRWSIPAAELTATTPPERFLRLRHLARRIGTRFVFCRSDRERKPYLIDLTSPLAADLLAHIAGHAGTIGVEPMSPAPGKLWLRDSAGLRYTSEARIQVTARDEAER